MNKDSMIYLFEWDEMCEDLTDEEYGQLIRAVSKYAQTGEKTTFKDRMLRSNFKTMIKATDRFSAKYAEKCEKNRENGKRGGRPKEEKANGFLKNPEKPNGFSENPKKANGFFKNPPERERDPERDRGREREEVAPSARITLTTTTSEEIARSWNGQNCTQDIQSCFYPDQRRDRTEMAVAISGGMERFLQLIEGLGSQAYFKDRNVDFDWFVDPKNFQNILEGKYKDPLKKAKEGWV